MFPFVLRENMDNNQPMKKIKKPAAPYSRAGGSRTTLGEEALDFRVRDGNGYGRLSVATGRKPLGVELKGTATHGRRVFPAPCEAEESQASRRISTAQLNASLRFHLRPIEAVVYGPA